MIFQWANSLYAKDYGVHIRRELGCYCLYFDNGTRYYKIGFCIVGSTVFYGLYELSNENDKNGKRIYGGKFSTSQGQNNALRQIYGKVK